MKSLTLLFVIACMGCGAAEQAAVPVSAVEPDAAPPEAEALPPVPDALPLTEDVRKEIIAALSGKPHVVMVDVKLDEDDEFGHTVECSVVVDRKISFEQARELATAAIVEAKSRLEPNAPSGPDIGRTQLHYVGGVMATEDHLGHLRAFGRKPADATAIEWSRRERSR
jgi:hypothetical protein